MGGYLCCCEEWGAGGYKEAKSNYGVDVSKCQKIVQRKFMAAFHFLEEC